MSSLKESSLARRSRKGKLILGLISALVMVAVAYFAQQQPTTSADGVILRVADGDTIEVRLADKQEAVRLIGIDAPETGHSPRIDQMAEHSRMSKKKIAQMGDISKQFVNARCSGATKVRLEFDSVNAPQHRDKYDRLLAYIYLTPRNSQSEIFLNADIVRQGYARAYTAYRFRYSRDFVAYEDEARGAKRGLWKQGALP